VEAVNQLAAASPTWPRAQIGAVTNLALASLGNDRQHLLMVVFLSVFILIDKDKIMAFFLRLAPPRYASEVRLSSSASRRPFGGFNAKPRLILSGVVLGLVAGGSRAGAGPEFRACCGLHRGRASR